MSEWQPIETAPKDGTIVLVWGYHEDNLEDEDPATRRPWPAWVSVQKHIWWLADGLRQVKDPTHWMPLPEAPADA
jgi:hypothetical protein